MATFASTTKSQIVLLLALPATKNAMDFLDGRLTEIESIDGGFLVTVIEQLIGEIDTLRQSVVSVQGSTSVNLRKADVVEWTIAGKGSGTIAQIAALKRQLRAILFGVETGSRLYRSDRYSLTGGCRSTVLEDFWLLAQ